MTADAPTPAAAWPLSVAAADAPPAALQAGEGEPARLLFAGDWAPGMGNTGATLAEHGRAYYGALADHFARADLRVVNLETVLDSRRRQLDPPKAGPRLIADPAFAARLADLPTDIACLANNHILDNGPDGLAATRAAVTESGMTPVGAHTAPEHVYAPAMVTAAGVKVAIVNAGEGEEANAKFNGGMGAADLEDHRVVDAIRAAKAEGALVVLVAHCGLEYAPTPPPWLRAHLHRLVAAGADAAIAHHPHVPQGMERVGDAPIFYSLGNFAFFRQGRRRALETVGYAVELQATATGIVGARVLPYDIAADGLIPQAGERLAEFERRFRETWSPIVTDPERLDGAWRAFARARLPIVDFWRVVAAHFCAPERVAPLVRNLATKTSYQFQLIDGTRDHAPTAEAARLIGAYESRRTLGRRLSPVRWMVAARGSLRLPAQLLAAINAALRRFFRRVKGRAR